MGSLAVFGITNDGANLVVSLLILFLLVCWLALVYWTYSDAKRRVEDPMLVGCATAAALFPFAGTLVYVIVRPPELIEDRRERELEMAAAEARLASIEHLSCPYCAFDVERSFLRCPNCLRRLKEPCATCGKPLDPRWKICPYCEAEIGQAPAQPRPRERRRARPPAPPPAQPVAAAPAAPAAPAEPPRRTKEPRPAGTQRKAAPASGNGEPARRPAGSRAQRQAPPPSRPGAEAPAGGAPPTADGRSRGAPDPSRAQRPAEAPRTPRPGQRAQRPPEAARAPRPGEPAQRPPEAARTPRPGEPAQRQRPSGAARKKRPAGGESAPARPDPDEATAERRAGRPRTRPPATG